MLYYRHDVLAGIFNPLHHCFGRHFKTVEEPPARLKHQVKALLDAALLEVERTVGELPATDYLQDLLVLRLRRRITEILNGPIPKPDHSLSLLKKGPMTILSVLSSPTFASASNGGKSTGCPFEPLVAPALMLFILIAIGRNCLGCRRRGPDTITVDHGCGGRKTYRRDHCSGRYRDDSCC
ncbi:hypothetical protein DSTSK_24560 [Desulforhabdus sp. TSK]|nr:hypothetical protein DSTSK_24560 [Desulforhabdus sp. TSK]